MNKSHISADSLNSFSRAYPNDACMLRHGLIDHPLLNLERLVALGTTLPPESVEYNPANLPVGIAPEDVPKPQLSIAETIQSIEENGSWMVLKRIEQDPASVSYTHLTLTTIYSV